MENIISDETTKWMRIKISEGPGDDQNQCCRLRLPCVPYDIVSITQETVRNYSFHTRKKCFQLIAINRLPSRMISQFSLLRGREVSQERVEVARRREKVDRAYRPRWISFDDDTKEIYHVL